MNIELPLTRSRNNTFPEYYMLPSGLVTWDTLNVTTGRANFTMRTGSNPEYVCNTIDPHTISTPHYLSFAVHCYRMIIVTNR